jgi:aspartate racemase
VELAERKAAILAFLRTATGVAQVAASPLHAMSRDEDLPLSFAQQRLWFLDQFEPGVPLYNISRSIWIHGNLHVSTLEQSLNEILRRHDALRTTFPTAHGQPVQVISPTLTVTLPTIDLRELPEPERQAAARRLAAQEARRPFDLAQGPLLRTTVLQLGEAEHVLLLTMHHIVTDGWSTGIFCRELAALYEAFSAGKSSPLPELTMQYADFARWQREYLQGEVLERQLSYWKQQLGSHCLPTLQLPTDRPRPAVQTYKGALRSLTLPKALSDSLKVLSQQENITLFMTLLAAFQVLLHRYSGQDDIVVGSPIAGRTRLETEALIGFFANTLVLRVGLSGNPSFRELLGRVREVALGAYAHQDMPFEKLVEALQPERSLSHAPLFQVMFALQNAPRQYLQLPGLTLSASEVHSETAKFDLTLLMTETAQNLHGVLEYNVELFDSVTIDRMTGHLQTILQGISTNPDQRIAELPLLTRAERHQLLGEWHDTQADHPREARGVYSWAV